MKGYIITQLRDRVIFPNDFVGYEEVVLTGKEFKILFPDYVKFTPSDGHYLSVAISYKPLYSSFPTLKDAGNRIKEIDFSKVTVAQVEKLLKL